MVQVEAVTPSILYSSWVAHLIALSASQLQTGDVTVPRTQLSIFHGIQTENMPFPHGPELPAAVTAHFLSVASGRFHPHHT